MILENKLNTIILSLGLVFVTSSICAQELKIGYVSTVKLLEQAPQGDAALKELESEFRPRDQQLKKTRNIITRLEDELEKDELVMKDSDFRKKRRDLRNLRRKLRRQTEVFREDYSIRRNEELQDLEKIVHKAILEVAKSEKYTLVIHQGVVYADDQIDITEKVLKNLSLAHKAN